MTLPETDSNRYPSAPPYRRDLVALVCIVVAVVGLVAIAWTIDWRLAAAVVCLAVLGVGIVVGIDR